VGHETHEIWRAHGGATTVWICGAVAASRALGRAGCCDRMFPMNLYIVFSATGS